MSAYEGETYTLEEYKKLNTATGKEFGKAGEEIVSKQAQDWRNQGSPVPGTKEPEDIRSLGSQLIDWATTPAGNATIGGLGLLALGAGATGLKARKGGGEQGPRVEPTFNDFPPTPPAGGPKPNFPQGDVTDVASRPVGQPRAQLGGPTAPTQPPVTPPVTPAPTAPTGVAGGAPAPANVAPAPVAPAAPPAATPVDPIMQAKLDAIAEKTRRDNEAHAAQQRRLDEIHQAKLDKQAKSAELGLQNSQGKASSQTNVQQEVIAAEKLSEKNKLANAVAKASAPKPVVPPTSPVAQVASVIPPANAPITAATPAPEPKITTAPATLEPTPRVSATEVAPTAKQASNIKEISLPKEWPSKGMNWLTAQYGIEGAQQFIDKYNEGKPFKTHAEMDAVYQKVMTKPSFSTMPKELRKERGIKATERELLKIIPRSVPPPAGGGSAGPVQGGGSLGGNRPGEDFMHNLNPLKL